MVPFHVLQGLPQVLNLDIASWPEAVAAGHTEQHLPLRQVKKKKRPLSPSGRQISLCYALGATGAIGELHER